MATAIVHETRFLIFREDLNPSAKTKRILIASRSVGSILAEVRWYGPWRQYVMSPESNTVWNPDCLRDVIAFIEGLMSERAEKEPK